MNAPNFQSVLDKRPSAIEKPRPMPNGIYLMTVDGIPVITNKGKDNTEVVIFKLRPQQAVQDVDPNELAEFTKLKPLNDRTIDANFWMTDAAAYRLMDFLCLFGLATFNEQTKNYDTQNDTPPRALLPSTMNQQILVQMKQTPSNDGSQMYSNPDKFFKAG
jgi:hypothetical protein